MRSTASQSIVFVGSVNLNSCFGRTFRDRGQKRSPEPPAMITANLIFSPLFPNHSNLGPTRVPFMIVGNCPSLMREEAGNLASVSETQQFRCRFRADLHRFAKP